MHVLGKCLRHLLSADVSDGMKGQTIMDLIVIVEVFPNGIHNQPKEVGILVH